MWPILLNPTHHTSTSTPVHYANEQHDQYKHNKSCHNELTTSHTKNRHRNTSTSNTKVEVHIHSHGGRKSWRAETGHDGHLPDHHSTAKTPEGALLGMTTSGHVLTWRSHGGKCLHPPFSSRRPSAYQRRSTHHNRSPSTATRRLPSLHHIT